MVKIIFKTKMKVTRIIKYKNTGNISTSHTRKQFESNSSLRISGTYKSHCLLTPNTSALQLTSNENRKPLKNENNEIYPADCRKIAAVDSHNSIGIERKEKINENWFLYKNIFKCELFWCHFVVEHTPVSQWEATGSSMDTNKHYR